MSTRTRLPLTTVTTTVTPTPQTTVKPQRLTASDRHGNKPRFPSMSSQAHTVGRRG